MSKPVELSVNKHGLLLFLVVFVVAVLGKFSLTGLR